MLNAADLVILGRSPNSGTFDGDDEPVWNALTAPLIVNYQSRDRFQCAWKVVIERPGPESEVKY